jgi:hypothetical protein
VNPETPRDLDLAAVALLKEEGTAKVSGGCAFNNALNADHCAYVGAGAHGVLYVYVGPNELSSPPRSGSRVVVSVLQQPISNDLAALLRSDVR